MLAAGLLEIGRLPDVHRPAIAAPLPAMRRASILIDAGANADARPEHLVQFAHMGTIFAEEILGVADPEVALLSIGEEPEKGNRLTREAHAPARGRAGHPTSSGTWRGGSCSKAAPTSSSATASRGTWR